MIERAFPLDHTPSTGYQRGMSLRDYFAANAMTTIYVGGYNDRQTAEMAYQLADAMMAAREA